MSALGDQRTLDAARKRHEQEDAIRDLARALGVTADDLRRQLALYDLTLTRKP